VTIFLHIGTHKTGTTAIQRHLGRHAEFYASQGLWYPREAELLNGGRDAPTHLNIARSLDCTSKPKPYSESQLQEMAGLRDEELYPFRRDRQQDGDQRFSRLFF